MQENRIEKRRHPRLECRVAMHYRQLEAKTQEYKGSLLRNISPNGAGMTLYEFLPLNSKLAMQIRLLFNRKPIQGCCRVAWVRKAAFSEQYDAGIEFDNLSQIDNEQIAEFILNRNIQG